MVVPLLAHRAVPRQAVDDRGDPRRRETAADAHVHILGHPAVGEVFVIADDRHLTALHGLGGKPPTGAT
ncbi:hypothetical protein ACIQMJ_19295 [Actinosynnema sp. NPDC091369]